MSELDAHQRQEQRIRFRQDLMSLPGGVAWLLHVSRLFDFRESVLGPGGFGLPHRLRVLLHERGW